MKMPRLRRNIVLMLVTFIMSAVTLHAWILLIFSSLLNDYNIVVASTIAAALDLPTGLGASFLVHQLGKSPTVCLAHFSAVLSAVICAVLVGMYSW